MMLLQLTQTQQKLSQNWFKKLNRNEKSRTETTLVLYVQEMVNKLK